VSYGHPAGTPGATGVERLRPRENGQRVSGGAWEGTDGFVETPHGFPLDYRDSSAISTGVAVLWSAATTPVRASVQTGEPPNLAREGDPIGLTAEAGGFARPNHGLTTVVTGHGLRYPLEISENSRFVRGNRLVRRIMR
jgi:hypothetical protein